MKPISISFYLSHPTRETSAIKARFSYKGKQYEYFPGISVRPPDWNASKMRCDQRKANAWETNAAIEKVERAVNAVLVSFYKSAIDPPGTKSVKFAIAAELEKMAQERPAADDMEFVRDFFETWIARKAAKKQGYFRRRWKTTIDNALELRPALRFSDLSEAFFQEFASYLSDTVGNKNNTVNGKVRRLQQLCREALKYGVRIHPHFADFKFKGEKIPAIYLVWEEVEAIAALKGLEPMEAYIRDRFLFRCLTGIRFSDMEFLSRDMVVSNGGLKVLRFDLVKQRDKNSIFLPERAFAIWERHGFDFSRAQWSSGQVENRIIKRLVRMAGVKRSVQVVRRQGEKLEAESLPIFRVVSTHTARRTFARAWYDRGGDLNKLREHLGHADLATTLRYVGVEKDETNREAARLFGSKGLTVG